MSYSVCSHRRKLKQKTNDLRRSIQFDMYRDQRLSQGCSVLLSGQDKVSRVYVTVSDRDQWAKQKNDQLSVSKHAETSRDSFYNRCSFINPIEIRTWIFYVHWKLSKSRLVFICFDTENWSTSCLIHWSRYMSRYDPLYEILCFNLLSFLLLGNSMKKLLTDWFCWQRFDSYWFLKKKKRILTEISFSFLPSFVKNVSIEKEKSKEKRREEEKWEKE